MTDSLSTIRHLINPIEGEALCPATEIYRNTNGDVWELFSTANPTRNMVRHSPRAGSEPTMVTVEEFLAVNSCGPEHAALKILLSRSGSDSAPE